MTTNLNPIAPATAERRGLARLAGPYRPSETPELERAAIQLARGGIPHAVVATPTGLELWRATNGMVLSEPKAEDN